VTIKQAITIGTLAVTSGLLHSVQQRGMGDWTNVAGN